MNKTGVKSEDVIKVRAVVGSLTEGVMKGRAYVIVETVLLSIEIWNDVVQKKLDAKLDQLGYSNRNDL